MSAPPGGAGRRLLRVLGAGLLALGAGACTSVGAKLHNLDALHSSDGFHNRSAVLVGDFEWNLRSGIEGLVSGSRMRIDAKDPRKIKRPIQRCLANLRELEGAPVRSPYQRAKVVECFARWAVECPWKLSRERSVLALTRLGRGLDLAGHPPPLLAGEPVQAVELGEALGALLGAVNEENARESSADPAGPAIEAECERVRSLPYDLSGVRRALEFVAVLAAQPARRAGVREPLLALQVDLERLCVHRALTRALLDESPFERSGSDSGWPSSRVQAAALGGLVEVFGPPALAEFLVKVDPRMDPELLRAILVAVRRDGLPRGVPGVSPQDERAWIERWTSTLVAVATEHPEGEVRVAAMRALETASGGELDSLREEDWLAWSLARRPAEGGEPALPAAPGAGAGGGESGGGVRSAP